MLCRLPCAVSSTWTVASVLLGSQTPSHTSMPTAFTSGNYRNTETFSSPNSLLTKQGQAYMDHATHTDSGKG